MSNDEEKIRALKINTLVGVISILVTLVGIALAIVTF